MIIKKLISGGQTGADRTALEVAEALGIPTGGWAPRGWKTDVGPDRELGPRFHLQEHSSANYRDRTYANVRESDATVWFGHPLSPGGQCTRLACQLYKKPWVENPRADHLRALIEQTGWAVLNVAGNRRRSNPEVVALTRMVLMAALSESDSAPPPAPPFGPQAPR